MKLSCCSILALAMLCSAFNVYADERSDEKDVLSKGYLSGSFDTNTNYYKEDGKTSAVVPDGKSGSNNYLKLDYYNDNFSA